MGYSCTAKASFTEEGVSHFIAIEFPALKSSNAMPDGGFYERGREQDDGSITGTVWRLLNAKEKRQWAHLPDVDERVHKRGSYRIDPEGKIVRWPGLNPLLKAKAEAYGAKKYKEAYPNDAIYFSAAS